jgi:YVTN family beta-propeller protein
MMKNAILTVGCLAAAALGQWLEETIWLPDSLSGVICPSDICYNPTENVMYVGGELGRTIMVVDAQTLDKKARVPVRQGVAALCFDRANNQLYCADTGQYVQSTVTVIDGSTNEVKAALDVGTDPCALCLDTVQGKLYCSVAGSGVVAVVNCETNQVVASVDVGSSGGLCWNPSAGKVYCANPGGATVTVIDCATDSVVATVPTPDRPTLVCYNPVQNKVYCAADSVVAIDCAADTVCGILPERATAFLFEHHQDKLYYLPQWWEEVWVADGAGDSMVAVLPVNGGKARALAADPSGKKVYCGVRGWLPTGAWVLVVDARQDSIIDSLHFGGHSDGVSALACGSSGDTLFACTFSGSGWSNGGVVVLDVARREILAGLTTSRYPRHLAYNSTENLVYVAEPERTRPSVVVVDAESNQVVDTIPAWPTRGLAYNSLDNKLYAATEQHLVIFDGSTHELIDTLDCLRICRAICYNPSSNKVYIAGNDQDVVIVDGAGDSVRARLTFETDIGLAVCAPELNRMFLGFRYSYDCRVFAVDGAGDTVLAAVQTGAYQNGICYCSSTREVYTACRYSEDVWVIDAVACSTTDVLDVGGVYGPVCYASGANSVYCSCEYPPRLEVIDCVTHQVLTSVSTPGTVTAMFYNEVNDRLYCGLQYESTLLVLDPKTNQIVKTFVEGDGPNVFAWNPVQNRVYVGNWYNSNLVVFRDSIPVGVAEKKEDPGIAPPTAPICRGTLMLPDRRNAELLDVTGRRVMDLQPGANDIRHLAPGVYFARRPETEDGRPRSAVRKVVVQR